MSMSSYLLLHSLFLLSHLSPFHLPLTSSSSTLSSPHLSISLNSLSPMGFSTLCLFMSFTSSSPIGFSLTSSPPQLIASSISYLNSPLPTIPTIGNAALEIFFTPSFYGGLCMKDANFFFLFCSLIRFVDFVVFVIIRIVVFFFFFWIYGFWTFVCSLWWLVFFFSLNFVIEVVCFVL